VFTPRAVPALISAIRWVSIVVGCVFAADSAVDGSVRSVVAIGLAVLVAVWWTLRDEPIDRAQDLIATLVLAAAAVLAEPIAAFLPAILASLAISNFASPFLEGAEPTVDAVSHVARAMGEPTPAEEAAALIERTETEERRRAAKVTERLAEWLTFTKTGLDRHLSRRPDRQLAEMSDDLNDAIREVEERTRQLKGRITASAPLSTHAGRMLEWWSDHYGGEVTLQITDPEARLGQPAEQALLTILTEALDNVGRHAQADHLTVVWRVHGGAGELRISDDGIGFDPILASGGGLQAMARAADRVGADLVIDSNPDDGTAITVRTTDEP
jgi:signal transduction histidine kinase